MDSGKIHSILYKFIIKLLLSCFSSLPTFHNPLWKVGKLQLEKGRILMLMRCLKVTDELAASGTTRGLELECKRYALRPIRFAWPEIIVSLLGVLFLAGLLLIDQTKIGEIILWRV